MWLLGFTVNVSTPEKYPNPNPSCTSPISSQFHPILQWRSPAAAVARAASVTAPTGNTHNFLHSPRISSPSKTRGEGTERRRKKMMKGMEEEVEMFDPYKLKAFDELPEYMKDNEYIRGHYRADWPIKRAFYSLFRWHNETLDVWTHLIGFFLFVGLTVIHLGDLPVVADLLSNFNWPITMAVAENTSRNDRISFSTKMEKTSVPRLFSDLPPVGAPRWPLFVFLSGSMFCFLSSSICHLLCCHSHRLNLLLFRMDYGGIAVMIVTSFFPPMYYIFQCEPHWQLLYLGGITVMGGFTIITLLSPQLSRGPFRVFRATLFLVMGFSGIVPAIHATVINWNQPQRPVTLAYESAMAVSYVTGTLFYVTRVPERWKPGTFDLTGHSHQIFHVFVLLGALAHYGATLVLLKWRDRVGCV